MSDAKLSYGFREQYWIQNIVEFQKKAFRIKFQTKIMNNVSDFNQGEFVTFISSINVIYLEYQINKIHLTILIP